MWRKPTLEDIAATLSEKEIEAFRTSIMVTSNDPIEELLYRGASLARSYCRANRAITLSPSEYEVPEALISPLCDYVAYDILKRLPLVINEDRKQARKDAISMFEKVANGTLTPESYKTNEEDIHARPAFNIPALPKRVLD